MPRGKPRSKKGGADAADAQDKYAIVASSARLEGVPGSRYVVFKLEKDNVVCADSASLLYMKDGITFGSLNVGTKNESNSQKFWGMLGRALAGETIFLQGYTGPGTVALGTSLPGDVVMLTIEPGETYYLSRGSFVAATDNIRISGGLNLIGIIGVGQEEGMVLPTIKTTDDSRGYVWIGAYGTFEKHDVPANASLIINNGLFLAATKKYDGLTKLGKSVVSSLFGEGLGMEFKGPCTVYTQSKNINELVNYIIARVPRGDGNSVGKDIMSGFLKNAFESEGGNQKPRRSLKSKK